MARVKIGGVIKEYPVGTPYLELKEEFQGQYENEIVLVMEDGRLKELRKRIQKDCEIEFITTKEEAGSRSYRRSVSQLLLKAMYDVIPAEKLKKVSILFSLSKGYYCKVTGDIVLTQELLETVKKRMLELVEADIPIKKKSVHTDEAIALFRQHRMYDKEKLFRFRRVSKVNIYSINEFQDYYYGYMVPSTGCLKYFDLKLYDDGFVLRLPTAKDPKAIPEFEPQTKLFAVLKSSKEWGERLGLSTVGELNEMICRGKVNEMILVQEALQEKKIAEIARDIAQAKGRKFVMIAGPSSSGKTTFSHRLSIQLQANGLNPHPIALDNYFFNRQECPLDEFGKPDFEGLAALDIEQFNLDMTKLLKEVGS